MSLPENRLSLAGPTSPTEAFKKPLESSEAAEVQIPLPHARVRVQEWPAQPKGTIEIQDGNGGSETITYSEWYSRLGISNRGGT